MPPAVYLDWNATAPLRPEARDALMSAHALTGNPSSVHGFGRAARRLVEDSRRTIAEVLGCAPAGIVFTGSGSEANTLALRLLTSQTGPSAVLATEHASVLEAARGSITIPVMSNGLIDLAKLDGLLREHQPRLVSVQAVNNETGVIQPLADIVSLCSGHNTPVHCDAVQAVGRIPIDFRLLKLDLMTVSAHKLGGPQGVAALILRDGIEVEALIRGGGQERRRRAGTENVAGITGFAASAAAAISQIPDFAARAIDRDRLERQMLAAVPQARILGGDAPRVANTICIGVAGLTAESQLMALDLAGFAVSSGAACSSGKVGRSHVLDAMGIEPELASGAIRISFGLTTSSADLDRFAHAWQLQCRRALPRLVGS
jgi:cysteine desulfurase